VGRAAAPPPESAGASHGQAVPAGAALKQAKERARAARAEPRGGYAGEHAEAAGALES
jgi:hypothetical protein